MGVAVVPTVFSIAEDAINAVPKSFAAGSLALGATHWQSYRDVVFPIATPGIIAAGMIGLGRAIGETMIVLLLASHTPLMELNVFEGLRTVSATLALELSEAPYESVHYRVLFAAGLALFALTFVLNAFAEFLRLRSRRQWLERA
jgi:phosphate transport system permease protein